MRTDRFEAKDPKENIVLTFDYEPALEPNEQLTPPVNVEVSVQRGGPDSNSNSILNGSPEIDEESGRAVLVPVKGGVDFTDYHIKTGCATSSAAKVLIVAGILPVREA